MYIFEKLTQHRRDFRAIYKCEHCGHEVEHYGYDDANFHENVIPNGVCPECRKTSGGVPYKPINPMYPEGYQV